MPHMLTLSPSLAKEAADSQEKAWRWSATPILAAKVYHGMT
jgi:hypothetical protein